jgi:hypothetical protein
LSASVIRETFEQTGTACVDIATGACVGKCLRGRVVFALVVQDLPAKTVGS